MIAARLTLPWPPSANNLTSTLPTGMRVTTGQAKAYRKTVADQVTLQRVQRHVLKGRLAVEIVVREPDRRRRDIANLEKAPIDALVATGVIADDSDIDVLHIRRGALLKGGEIELQISEIVQTIPGKHPLFGEVA